MKKRKYNRDVFRALALLTQIGISMLVPILLCLFIGIRLDRWLGTGCFLFIFLIIGILAAYRSLYTLTKPLLKGEREREDELFRDRHQGQDKSQ